MLDENVRDEIIELARSAAIPPAALLAVCEVESGGRVFARIKGRDEPLIRFEGHYFHRLLAGAKRNRAKIEGLANRNPGAVKNSSTQAGRWAMLAKASAIDREAALQSCSWGIGQVMGAHWRWLDYANVDALVADTRSGVGGQVRLMLKFIEKSGLTRAMKQQDWQVFARGYNGPAFARNAYDSKLAMAHEQFVVLLGEKVQTSRAGRNVPWVLEYGDLGDDVRDLQLKLQAYGAVIVPDGNFGPVTKHTLIAFQNDNKLVADGIAGPETFLALERVLGKRAIQSI